MEFKCPHELKYTKEHEWMRMEGDVAIIGITDYAQQKLKNIVFVELPEAGKETAQGNPVAVLESVKSISDVFSPVSGKVIEVNRELADKPELLNESPYEKGWIAKVKVSNPGESDSLMDSISYEKFVKGLG